MMDDRQSNAIGCKKVTYDERLVSSGPPPEPRAKTENDGVINLGGTMLAMDGADVGKYHYLT